MLLMESLINESNDIVKQASFILYQKVKISVALIFMKLIPPSSSVQEYAVIFQHRFRNKAKFCNLFLEKELFYNQLLVLLPALKIYSFNRNDKINESMEIDFDSECDAREFLKLNRNVLNEHLPLSANLTENYLKILHKINSAAQFLDAVIATKLLCDENRNIVQADMCKILAKFGEMSTSTKNIEQLGNYSFISCNLLQYFMRSVNINRIIIECVIYISKLLEEYFKQPVDYVLSTHGFVTVQFASNILLKTVENFPHIIECHRVLITFIHKSISYIFSSVTICRSIGHCWYILLSDWKQLESICVEMIDSLLCFLKKFEKDSLNKTLTSEAVITIRCILILTKRVLNSYIKLHVTSANITTEAIRITDLSEIKLHQKVKLHLTKWEKTLKNFIIHSISEYQDIVRLSWNCLKIIIWLKHILIHNIKKLNKRLSKE